MTESKQPSIAITMGDPAGVGPEVVLKSLAHKKVYEACAPLVIGDAQVLSQRSFGLKIRPILNPAQAKYKFGVVDVLHMPTARRHRIPVGTVDPVCGELSYLYVKKSVELALAKLVRGVVHAPISKEAWRLAKIYYPGHTELIAELCGIEKFGMAIVSEPLRTVMVTRHLSLRQVSAHLKKQDIVDTVELTLNMLKQYGVKNPRIGVCAMNPHAGENGLMGNEEIKKIRPAVQAAQKKFGGVIQGPLPADAAFRDHKKGLWDGLVTMYHDQSMIPLKVHNSDRLVNITLGLPFVRTSPGHGTAFEIAGKNKADALPMVEAILKAARMSQS